MKVVIPVGALHIGGGCRVLADIANALHHRGHEVTVVIPEGMPVEYHLDCKLLKVSQLGKDTIPYGDIVLPNFYTTFQPAFEAWPNQCVRLCQGYEPLWVPDAAYAQSTYAQGVPIISVSHWLDDQIYQAVGQRSRVINLGINRKLFHPHTAKRHSAAHQRTRRHGKGDHSTGGQGTDRQGRGRHQRPTILYMARDPQAGYELKGYYDFVEAMRILKRTCSRKFTVHMICPERILPLPGIAHRTFQPKNDREIARLYRSADLFVSTSWFEGFGLPPLEAMSCGTPVVTTNSGGILDYCSHKESAYIVAPRNPEELAHGIKRMLYSRNLKRRLIENGLESAKEHTKKLFERRIVRALEDIYAQRSGTS